MIITYSSRRKLKLVSNSWPLPGGFRGVALKGFFDLKRRDKKRGFPLASTSAFRGMAIWWIRFDIRQWPISAIPRNSVLCLSK
jgi:hypothetical protein